MRKGILATVTDETSHNCSCVLKASPEKAHRMAAIVTVIPVLPEESNALTRASQ
jgi:hypothetical protein